jgi:hypothetical protein
MFECENVEQVGKSQFQWRFDQSPNSYNFDTHNNHPLKDQGEKWVTMLVNNINECIELNICHNKLVQIIVLLCMKLE